MRNAYTFLFLWLTVKLSRLSGVGAVDVACDTTLALENGAVFLTSDSALANTIRVSCHSGFILQGEDSIKCQNGRVSTTKLPTCVEKKECPLNYFLQNGNVSVSSPVLTGDVVLFTCSTSYQLTTPYNTLTCRQNGTFDREFPRCKLKGENCTLDQTVLNANFISTNATRVTKHLDTIEFSCEHGYYMKTKSPSDAIVTCNNGAFSVPLHDMCHFVGFNCAVYNETNHVVNASLKYEKDETIVLTCVASSNTTDGLPLPQIMWRYPPKLRSYVELHGDFAHQTYINSVKQNYSRTYDQKTGKYTAVGVLTISPTMEVHNGVYTCSIRLFNETLEYKTEIVINTKYEVAMYCLIGIPIILFLAIHCFYRNANTLNPFPHNKLTKSMMQDMIEDMKRQEKYDGKKHSKREIIYRVFSSPDYYTDAAAGGGRMAAAASGGRGTGSIRRSSVMVVLDKPAPVGRITRALLLDLDPLKLTDITPDRLESIAHNLELDNMLETPSVTHNSETSTGTDKTEKNKNKLESFTDESPESVMGTILESIMESEETTE